MRDLIYSADKWTSYLWKRLLKDSAVVREHVECGASKLPTFPSFAREVFARLYAKPTLLARTRPEDEWAKGLHSALDELPSWQSLTAHCAHNKELASAAAATVLEQIVEKLPAPTKPLADPDVQRREVRGLLDFLNAAKESGDAQRARDLEAQIDQARKVGTASVTAMFAMTAALNPDDVRQALRGSIDAAAHEVEEIASATAGLSGLGGASAVSEATQALLGTALKSSEQMRRLGLLAGRMRRIAMGKRRSRTRAAASELSDVTTGNDLARVLPHELLKLVEPLLTLDFLRAFAERALLQYELSGTEREGQGPVVVLIDDSDSMDGAPSTFAKATALALADLALSDRRACRLVRFSHRLNATLDLRPGRDTTTDLLTFLAGNVDGGTNFELPLRAARAAIDNEPVYERADVVLITDGEAELSEEFLGDWRRRAKQDGLSTYAIHIGGHAPPVLTRLTSDVIQLSALLPEQLEDKLFARLTH